jgi:hypothetical protein
MNDVPFAVCALCALASGAAIVAHAVHLGCISSPSVGIAEAVTFTQQPSQVSSGLASMKTNPWQLGWPSSLQLGGISRQHRYCNNTNWPSGLLQDRSVSE